MSNDLYNRLEKFDAETAVSIVYGEYKEELRLKGEQAKRDKEYAINAHKDQLQDDLDVVIPRKLQQSLRMKFDTNRDQVVVGFIYWNVLVMLYSRPHGEDTCHRWGMSIDGHDYVYWSDKVILEKLLIELGKIRETKCPS